MSEETKHEHIELLIRHCTEQTLLEGVNLTDNAFHVMEVLFAGLSVAYQRARMDGTNAETIKQYMHTMIANYDDLEEDKVCLHS